MLGRKFDEAIQRVPILPAKFCKVLYSGNILSDTEPLALVGDHHHDDDDAAAVSQVTSSTSNCATTSKALDHSVVTEPVLATNDPVKRSPQLLELDTKLLNQSQLIIQQIEMLNREKNKQIEDTISRQPATYRQKYSHLMRREIFGEPRSSSSSAVELNVEAAPVAAAVGYNSSWQLPPDSTIATAAAAATAAVAAAMSGEEIIQSSVEDDLRDHLMPSNIVAKPIRVAQVTTNVWDYD